jgi:DNA invertase Pin-like site-specific DNA recombinase
MIYGYARVSTKGQDRYGNGLQEQTAKLLEAGCEEIYSDSFTGTTIQRPEFSKLLSLLKEGDTLVVTKLDRFARNAADGAKTVQELVDRGVVVHVLNMGRADNSPMGKLMTTILLAFSEFERDMIVERTTSGKEVAKAKDPNWREGRKPLEVPDFEKILQKRKKGLMTVEECYTALGISRRTWYNKVSEYERSMQA